MKVKCSYCGQYFDDSAEKCPSCGAPNDHIHRTSDSIPKTIEELKVYCDENGLTPERTRFFVGVDYKEPKAFGIYKDDKGEFVVYKNKANGERAVRYRGVDEAYAVNELYERLQDEILNQKSHHVERQKAKAVKSVKREQTAGLIKAITMGLVVVMGVSAFFFSGNKHNNGYYHYNNQHYYSLDDTWYYYDDTLTDWYPASSVPEDLAENADDYYDSSYYDYNSNTTNFEDTDYYSDWEESRSSDDDDSDWSSSDWDSGDTDWDSDW